MRQRVRAKRLKLKMSQAELGRRVGISRVAVCEYEAGRENLSDATIERMCTVLEFHRERIKHHARELAKHAGALARIAEAAS